MGDIPLGAFVYRWYALELKRPVLVGWSYAGRIVEDYLEHYGTARIAGINYVW